MADEQEKGKPEEEGADTTDWKAMARKWKARSKENADKARAYDELQVEWWDVFIPPFSCGL